jgi:uncharacterized protein YeeX (DUF496 family)
LLFGSEKTKNTSTGIKNKEQIKVENSAIKDKDLKEQVKYILELPDSEYSDKMLTSQIREYITEVQQHYNSTISDYKSHIAPSYWEFK